MEEKSCREAATAPEHARTEARYRATFHDAAIGIVHTRPDGSVIEANAAFCTMLGYVRTELARMRLSDILVEPARSDDTSVESTAMCHSSAEVARARSRIEQYRRHDGSLIWASRTVSAAIDADAERYLIHFIDDVTERRRAEELRRQSDLRYRRTLESALDCIVTTDAAGYIVEFNPMAERVFGYSRQNVIGCKLADVLVPPRLRARHDASMQRLVANGESMLNRRIETIALRADNTTIPVELMMQRITDTDPPLFTGFLRDISARKAAEAKILRLNRLYRTLSQTSALIVRANDRTSLLQGICRIARRYGGFLMSWVGVLDEEKRTIRLQAHVEDRAFRMDPITLDDPADPIGAAAVTAVRDARIVVQNEIQRLVAREGSRAEERSARSVAALPLFCGGSVLGVFVLCSSTPQYFDEDIKQLLHEMVAELSYAIDRLRLEEMHRDAIRALRESDERFRQLAENIPQMFWLSEPALDRALYVSPAYQALTGRPEGSTQERFEGWLACVHPDDFERLSSVRRTAARRGGYDVEYRIRDAAGHVRWVQDRAFPILDENGRLCRIAGIVSDITAARHASERLAHMAHYDQLTNLPNRNVMHERLTQAIAQAARRRWTVGVMFIDLDRFKTVNDTMGHSIGDALLRDVARRLSACVRGEDTVSRVSGDEFAIVLPSMSHPQDAAVVASKILNELKRPFDIDGAEIAVSASVGITLYPQDGHDADILMRNADIAMYNAKSRGRDSYRFYTSDMNARAVEKLRIESRLRGALERGEFALEFQPKVRLSDGVICGFEALIRWRPPEGRGIAPADFIPVLEETGLIARVGEWVVQRACRQVRAWSDAGLTAVPVAINLSARQLRHAGFAELVKGVLDEYALPGRLLEVEITESSLMENPDEAHGTLLQLKELGVNLAIDDFGTGYSSLSHLKRYPFDTLKIDRSFVRDVPGAADDVTIARTMIALGHGLGLEVVAEGVETDEQLSFLIQNGCEYAQGYLFSRSVRGEETARLLRRGGTFAAAGFASTVARRRASRL